MYTVLLIIGILIFPVSVISLKMAIAYYRVPQPQAILVLGGSQSRMRFAAELMQKHSDLKVWVSDYWSNYEANSRIFRDAKIEAERIKYDFCATDTVTNFTCNVRDFIRAGIRRMYLVTSDYHIKRSLAIATLVLGSRGIIVTPVSVPSMDGKSESLVKVLRDIVRSILWITTGRTGASLNQRSRSQM